MATKKTQTKKVAADPEAAPKDTAPQPETVPDPQPVSGDIDKRMAALLADHKRMGSR